jgi:hypothetical protein
MRLLPSVTLEPVSVETLRRLAELFDLALPAEDIEPLSVALADQLAAIRILDQMDLLDINPVLEFDPRWDD